MLKEDFFHRGRTRRAAPGRPPADQSGRPLVVA